MATMITMISGSYVALEATLTHMNNIKLASFPGDFFLTAVH